ncbi:prostaglandin reductase 1 [Agrilus planipennis]|uniref:Prostaglandin reductase 1 n=1 Tax=Agrilus planipennis TaxID=224129 RepID=A0A1W4X7P4_AGRPL|nr:prostaglandin reductase 1 [Agrilus planipennis]
MVVAKKYVIQKHRSGLLQPEDVKIVEEELPELKEGEFLAQAHFISIDPYIQYLIHDEEKHPVGSTIPGTQIALIYDSKNPKFPIGKYIYGNFGMRTYTIGPLKDDDPYGMPPQYILPDFNSYPYSYGLGILGMPGITANKGFLGLCKPQPGETVVVTTAAGAVGSVVGQIAKIKGCRVVGIAGSDEKGKWLVDVLGFDKFINYKRPDFAKKLKDAAPDGIDCYFDNVGGEISSIILSQMNKFGRISVSGSISAHNVESGEEPKASIVQRHLVLRQLKMEGFMVTRWRDEWFEIINQNLQWLREGKLKYKEHIVCGFDNFPKAVVDLMTGANTGKVILNVMG